MTTWDDFAVASRELLTGLDGEQGTVTRSGVDPVTLMLFVEDDTQQVGDHGRVIGRKRTIIMMKADWNPARGDIIDVRGASSKVDEILSDDGIVVTAVMHG